MPRIRMKCRRYYSMGRIPLTILLGCLWLGILQAFEPVHGSFFSRKQSLTPAATSLEACATTKPISEMTAIVIGAGPAGLSCSLALSRVCKSVMVVEKKRDFRPHTGASIVVVENGKKALQELCPPLVRDLEVHGIAMLRDSHSLLLPWYRLRDLLVQHVQKCPNVKLIMGKSFSDIHDHGSEGVEVVFSPSLLGSQNEKEENVERIRGDFLIGADGVHSQVREWLGLPPTVNTDCSSYRGIITVTKDCSPALQALTQDKETLSPLRITEYDGFHFMTLNYSQKQEGQMSWLATVQAPVPEGTHPWTVVQQYVQDPSQRALLREILERSPPEALEPFSIARTVDMSPQVLEPLLGRWGGRGRVTLVGDAAHAMRPTDGQGGNQAYEDAVVLARTLSSCSTMDIPHALADFEQTRLPRVQRIHESQQVRYEERMRSNGKPQPLEKEMRDYILQGV